MSGGGRGCLQVTAGGDRTPVVTRGPWGLVPVSPQQHRPAFPPAGQPLLPRSVSVALGPLLCQSFLLGASSDLTPVSFCSVLVP